MRKWFGDKKFYRRVLAIGVPVVIQQFLLTTFGFVDTLMVGSIERGVAGVGIAAQIEMILNCIIFGVNSGIGLYIAQFFGAKDEKNIRKSVALMFMICSGIALTLTLVIAFFTSQVVNIFTQDTLTATQTINYIKIACFSYLPNVLSFALSTVYRNLQQTKTPLVISICSMSLNVLFNYLLIFGIGPFPQLGVKGAAVATMMSCWVGFIIHVIYAFKTKKSFVPKLVDFKECLEPKFSKQVLRVIVPLIFNETLFSVGSATYVVIMNKLGPDAYEGYRMAETVVNMVLVVSMGLSTAVSAMLGESLGKGDLDRASNYGNYFLTLGLGISFILAFVNFAFSHQFIGLFNSDSKAVTDVAVSLMPVFSLRIFLRVFIVIIFSAFRSGGKSKIVMFLDAGIMWMVGIPLAFIAYNFLHVENIVLLYLIIQIEPLTRVIIGLVLYFKRFWIQNLTKKLEKSQEECNAV